MASDKKETEIQRLDGEMVGGSGSVLTETLVGLGLGNFCRADDRLREALS